jgi:hypothetical protein
LGEQETSVIRIEDDASSEASLNGSGRSERDPQYKFDPVSPDTNPPFLPDHLMHLFDSPSCIHGCEQVLVEQLPKRTKGELIGEPRKRAKGWGLFYEEGWDMFKIMLLVAVMVFGSFLFGVLWSILQKDVQGAFGISAWFVTIVGSTLALFALSSSRL